MLWNYKNANFDSFRENLRNADWDTCFEFNNIDEICNAWTNTFLNVARMTIPNSLVEIRPSDKPFFTSALRLLRRRKERARKEARRLNTEYLWGKFRDLRNLYNRSIIEAKEVYDDKLCDLLAEQGNKGSKNWWRVAKSFMGKNTSSSYPPLADNNISVTDNVNKCNLFNNYFLSHSNIDTSNAMLPDLIPPENSLNNIVISEQEVFELIKCMDTSKATGPDLVSPRMLKEASDSIVPSLTRLFRVSITSNKFPLSWKRANVLPLFKKDDPGLVDNYRPVSLLSCTGKLLERLIFKNVYNFLQDNDLITARQSGFRPGDSSVYQLTHLYHLFCKALDEKKEVRIVYCDISKAFDRVWHDGLIYKLQKIGIGGDLLNWFKSYLSNRQQRVTIDGVSSTWGQIMAGVPQGSVLGPLLFLIYINDICDGIESEIRLFADDTTVYVVVDNPVSAANQLNSDLEKMNLWAKKWLVKFSSKKTKSMIVSLKRDEVLHPPLFLDGTQLDRVSKYKHLGLIIQDNLAWGEHVQNICTTASKRVDIMSHLKYKLDRATLETIYKCYIRPLLEYGDVVWDNCNETQSDSLELIQKRAGRIICGAILRTSTEILYSELGWTSLVTRRKANRLSLMHKTVNSDVPSYLRNILPGTVGDRCPYPLRNRDNIDNINFRLSLYERSFFPHTITEYNELDGVNVLSSKQVRDRILRVEKPRTWYYTGIRKWSIMHARLRMRCSQLSYDLYMLNIIENQKCTCGNRIEDAAHYFLYCPLYIRHRRVLFDKLSVLTFFPSLDNILFGNILLHDDVNKQAVLIIHEYMENSERF